MPGQWLYIEFLARDRADFGQLALCRLDVPGAYQGDDLEIFLSLAAAGRALDHRPALRLKGAAAAAFWTVLA